MLRPKDGISMEDKLAKSQNLKSPPKIQPGVMPSNRLLGGVPFFNKVHAIGDLRQRLFPVVFILNGNRAIHPLSLIFRKNPNDVGIAIAKGHIVQFFA